MSSVSRPALRRVTRRAGAVAALLAAGLLAVPVGAATAGAEGDLLPRAPSSLGTDPDPSTPARTTPFALVEDRDVDDRLPQPEDRYALAGGCYAIEAPGVGWLSRSAGGALAVGADRAAALPLHLQATRLGDYLLATDEGPDTSVEGAWWDERGFVTASQTRGSAGTVSVALGAVVLVADAPSEHGEWTIVAAGADPDARDDAGQTYTLTNFASGEGLTVRPTGLALTSTPTPVRFHHVVSDDCAVWPEIDVNADGRPAPTGNGPAGEALGFFEAHVHGMAYEFLGGELRCGAPWHPYGVEHALGDCYEQGNVYNGVLEVGLAGQSPTDPVASYDPVGWPTFSYWPQHDTLTHEQFYWRWVERAWLGGLRLYTNLLVDNTALCQVFPAKRNSCNEMDGVRLQAQRVFELQDYIDAQNGGPGEGWLRVVTDPAQARATINAGRLAVVLGIEVSELFDCREVLDQPQCTADEIDTRLDEVFDMGVRQMELINKFDNALAGVTGDGGTTGVVVNQGNRYVTGHYWDMRTCPPTEDGHAHEHDKRQLNVGDDVPDGGRPEFDVLAGIVLEQFGPATRGAVAPVYPKGPHCNSRGLTDLGAHLIRRMVEKGMVFDPDHMSAAAQRSAMDLIQDELVPAELEAAAAEGRAPRLPAVISSHSWGNDEIYQRIQQVAGHVAPRTASSDRFVDDWVQLREWADINAPAGALFGMGYGADTNGLGGQPGPRGMNASPLVYDADGFEAPIGGVRLFQQTSGVKTFDVNRDGVAHYGLFADWFAELALAADEEHADAGGAEALLTDMLNGAESYIQMWERVVFGGNECVADGSRLQVEDLHALLGGNVEGFLTAAGQPVDRDGAAYTYCVEGAGGEVEVVDVRFDAAGVATEVVPSASGIVPTAAGADATGQDADAGHADGHGHTAGASSHVAVAGHRAGDHAPGDVHAAGAVAAARTTAPGSSGGALGTVLGFAGLVGLGVAALRRRATAP
ncbi:MAG: hypothetical protein ACLGIR_10340 [Actinomycetes bacterium]